MKIPKPLLKSPKAAEIDHKERRRKLIAALSADAWKHQLPDAVDLIREDRSR